MNVIGPEKAFARKAILRLQMTEPVLVDAARRDRIPSLGEARLLSLPPLLRIIGLMAGEAAVVVGLLTWSLRLHSYDITVPLNYHGDTLWFVSLAKGLLDNGWTFFIPQLSAPFGLAAIAFPQVTTFDWGVMKVIGWIIPHPGAILNIFWLVSLVLTAWSATLALHLLGVRLWLAVIGGLVFALSPFASIRNTAHICLTFFPVPLICCYAVHIAGGVPNSTNATKLRRWGYVASLIQGFNYVYFSFFAVALYLMAGVLGFFRTRDVSIWKYCAIGVAIVVAATAVNLSPSLYSWSKDGKPTDMDYKHPAEAETYGLKLRRMLVPSAANPIPLLRAWGRLDNSAGFSTENENVSARLGLFAAVGFLLSICALMLYRNSVQPSAALSIPQQTIAALTLGTFLITTVGGFGAIFNVVVAADVRAYNRFSVFLAFLSIAWLCVGIEASIASSKPKRVKWAFIAAAVGLAVISVQDQLLELAPLKHRQAADQMQAVEERLAVQALELAAPGATVFQLPVTGFPPDGPHEKMGAYDHARPFLWSHGTFWSWPSFSLRHRAWLDEIETLRGRQLLEALSLSGFSLIWIDRYGFGDSASQLIKDLTAAGAVEVALGKGQRYATLDLRQVTDQLKSAVGEQEFELRSRSMLNRVTYSWGKGFYPEERSASQRRFRWGNQSATLTLRNSDLNPRRVRLKFELQSHGSGAVSVEFDGRQLSLPSSWNAVPVEMDVDLGPGQTIDLNFFASTPKVAVSGETRSLYFTFLDFQLDDRPEVRKEIRQ